MDPTVLVLVALVGLGIWFWTRRSGSADQAERRLHRICLGDRAQMERLIDLELARAPDITRSEAISRALARHERDNR